MATLAYERRLSSHIWLFADDGIALRQTPHSQLLSHSSTPHTGGDGGGGGVGKGGGKGGGGTAGDGGGCEGGIGTSLVHGQLHEARQLLPMTVFQSQEHATSPSVGHPSPMIEPVSRHCTGSAGGDGGGDGAGGGGGVCGGAGQHPHVTRQCTASSAFTSESHVHPNTCLRLTHPPPMIPIVSSHTSGGG